jgi:hypothetical protein
MRILELTTRIGFSEFSVWERNGLERKGGGQRMSILWILLIVILVLALLGFFSRGYW